MLSEYLLDGTGGGKVRPPGKNGDDTKQVKPLAHFLQHSKFLINVC